MAQPTASLLELGLRTGFGPFGEARMAVRQGGLVRQRRQDVFGVFLPVRRGVQVPARGEAAGEEGDERTLDEAPLVVALLGPGVGEEDVDAREGPLGDHLPDNLDGVVLDDPNICECLLIDALEQRADPGRMHLDAEVVVAGALGGDPRRRLPHAESDLEDLRGFAPEDGREVERLGGIGDPVLRHERVVRPLLAG